MAEKRLGAGLEALFGDLPFENETVTERKTLPIAKIEPRADQPREVFDEERLEELADSIKEHGLLQPLTVRKLDGGFYQIVAGERRWRAARMAGLTEVPVYIIEADDQKASVLALVENLQREDLNPVEEAKGYRTLMSEYGLTQEQAAAAVGKSRPVIANAVRLLTLPESILDMISSGKLSMSQGRALLELKSDEDRLAAAQVMIEKDLNVRQAAALIERMKKTPAATRSRVSSDGVDYVAVAEKQLSDALGRGVKISYGRKKGKIELEYYGEEDFENLLALLEGLKGGNHA